MSLRPVIFLVCLLPGLLLAAPLQVVVSVLPLQTFVEQVGGDTVRVQSMVEPGFDPHHYEPSPQQIGKLAAKTTYFTLGLPSEAIWIRRMQAINPSLQVINVASGPLATAEHAHDHRHDHDEHDHHLQDEHIWTSPANSKQIISAIAQALARLAPQSAEAYNRNATRYREQLTALEHEIEQQLQQHSIRTFMVVHPAWEAFAEQFGLEQIAIEVEGKDPGPRSLAQLIERARAEQIRLILTQAQFSPRAAQQISAATGARVAVMDPLAADYSANLRRLTALLVEAGQP